MENFDIWKLISENKMLVLLLLGVGLLYLILNFVFKPRKQNNTEEEDEDEMSEFAEEFSNIKIRTRENVEKEKKEKKKIKKGYKEVTSSYIGSAKNYDFVPKDGGSYYGEARTSRSRVKGKKNKGKAKFDLDERYGRYYDLFYRKKIKDLSFLAREMMLPNEQVIKDLKQYRKDNKFTDIKIDEINSEIIYINDTIDRSENILYVEEKKEKTEKELEHGKTTHKCPNCGTENIIEKNEKQYMCYYCMNTVKIKK